MSRRKGDRSRVQLNGPTTMDPAKALTGLDYHEPSQAISKTWFIAFVVLAAALGAWLANYRR